MYKAIFISILFYTSCYAQDTLIIDDGSVWWTKSSCSIDYRCYPNIDDLVEMYCSDSICIASIELQENVFELSKNTYTDCRINRLGDYLRGKHKMVVDSIISTPILMNAADMRSAIKDKKYRKIILTFKKIEAVKD